ncbi:host attachment family protein [Aliiroseovarius subalbicans]|uniref:baeRF12 domain-containing protein n=1 Tax=Aliiroseovarius subalbicans TaxID=2925840 RepID=UPI001F5A30CE|nr:host attachment family protein [Aliiroseovarius subalbicans]MCI2398557.1 host attachment family protein [Aliiroseovarius subalbicans]
MKAVRTLVVIANEANARLFENEGVGKGLSLLESLDKTQFADAETRYADAPGKSSAAPGMAGHAMDRNQSERDQMREAFARHVLNAAEAQWKRGGFDRLAMSASPKMLGSLRAGLSAPLKGALAVDLDKDLSHATPAELVDHFGKHIVF